MCRTIYPIINEARLTNIPLRFAILKLILLKGSLWICFSLFDSIALGDPDICVYSYFVSPHLQSQRYLCGSCKSINIVCYNTIDYTSTWWSQMYPLSTLWWSLHGKDLRCISQIRNAVFHYVFHIAVFHNHCLSLHANHSHQLCVMIFPPVVGLICEPSIGWSTIGCTWKRETSVHGADSMWKEQTFEGSDSNLVFLAQN